MTQAAEIIGTGLATTGLIGAGVGIGAVFGALILGIAKSFSLKGQLFSYAMLGFAFAEATGLFIPIVSLEKGVFITSAVFSFGFILLGAGLLGFFAKPLDLPVPGRKCPSCALRGQTVWVIPGKRCPQCGTQVN